MATVTVTLDRPRRSNGSQRRFTVGLSFDAPDDATSAELATAVERAVDVLERALDERPAAVRT